MVIIRDGQKMHKKLADNVKKYANKFTIYAEKYAKNVKNANKNADPHSENKGYLLALGSEG